MGDFVFKKFLKFLSQPTKVLERVGVHHFDRLYERLLSSEKSLKWIALLIVIIVYIGIKFTPNLSLSYAEDVRGKTLDVVYDETTYVVEGLPKSVDVTLQGKESLVRNVITNNTFSTYVDLTGLKPGRHLVDIKYDLIPSGLLVDINPKSVSILIHELVQTEKVVDLELLNQDLLDPTLALGNFVLSNETVLVKGAKETLEKMVKVKAYINLNEVAGLKKSLEGTTTHEVIAPLYVVDAEGNKLNVQIEPAEVKVVFESSVPQKTVQLKPRLVGELPKGKVVRSVDMNPSEITIYAPQNVLDGISDLPFDVDVNQLNENHEATFNVLVPENVPKISANQIHVRLNLETAHERTFDEVKIGVQNLPSGLVIKNGAALTTTVAIKGVKETVEGFEEKDLFLVVDLTDLTVGKHKVKVQILNKKTNLIYSYPEEITLELIKE